MQPELVADYECETGEGPLWHPEEEVVYWVDIPNGILYRYEPATDEHEIAFEDDVIGGFTIESDGALLLFEDAGVVKRWREGESATVVAELEAARDTRFNDVIADPRGRVFCGTMPTAEELGALYRLDRDGTFTEVVSDVDISNGMGFTHDRETMYFTESQAHSIYAFDFDEATGELSNRSVFAESADRSGIPDGMTVDARGDVWSARWDGYRLERYDPDGALVERVEFPVRKVSSVTFGGPEYERMFVTTAGGDDRPDEGEHAGSLYALDPPVSGRPEFRSRVAIDD